MTGLLIPLTGVDRVSKTHMKECTVRPCVCGSDTKRDDGVRRGDAVSDRKVSDTGTNCTFSTFTGNEMSQKTVECARMIVV